MSQKFAKNLLVTGANRGLGLEFVKKLANRVDIIFAGCRKPSEAQVSRMIEYSLKAYPGPVHLLLDFLIGIFISTFLV